MATNQRIYSIRIDGIQQEITSISQLRAEAERLEEELSNADFGSDNFNRLSQQFKEITSELKDIDESLEGLSSVERADNALLVGEGLAGGFAIATVAAQQFGDQSAEAVAKYEQQALQLIVLLDGLKRIQEANVAAARLFGSTALANFKLAGLGAKNFSATTRTALAATGIGLLVVALGLVVAYWKDISNAVTNAIKPLKNVSDSIGGISGAFTILKDTALIFFTNIGEAFSNLVKGNFKEALEDVKDISRETQQAVKNQIVATQKELEKELQTFRDAEAEYDNKIREQKLNQAIFEKEQIISIEKAKGNEVGKLQLELFDLQKKLYAEDSQEYKKIQTEKTLFLIEQEQKKLEALKQAREEQANIETVQGADIFGTEEAEKQIDPALKKINDLLLKKFAPGLKKAQKEANKILAEDTEDTPSLLEAFFGFSDEDETEDKIAAIADKTLQAYDFIAQSITTSLSREIERATRNLEQLTEEQTQSVDRINSLETRADTAKGERKKEILSLIEQEKKRERELAQQKLAEQKKIEEAERRRAVADKIRAIASSVINTAVSVTEALPNLILAGIVGVLGAAQTAVIARQKFQDGGLLKGPLHSQGGIPIYNRNNGQVVEAEGNEYFVNRQATANNLSILERINSEGRKRKFKLREFAEGGMNSPDFQAINSSLNSQSSSGTGQIKVDIGLNEYTRTNSRVKEIKRTAKL